jgi:xanthine/uracil permease
MAVGLSAAEDHPVNEVLPFGQMFVYGLQHVLSMYAGVVAVPLIVGTALKLSGPEITYLVSAGLFMCLLWASSRSRCRPSTTSSRSGSR